MKTSITAPSDIGSHIALAQPQIALSQTPTPSVPVVATAFSYCAECGNWGDHKLECDCCGFSFRAEAERGGGIWRTEI